MSEINKLSKNDYPKFNPKLHLIEKKSNLSCKFNIENLNIFSPECNSYIEPLSNICFPIFSNDCIKIIQWELNNFLKFKDKCKNLKQFNKFNSFSFINFESPILKNCSNYLPFLFDAFTNNETINLLSNQLGFPIEIIYDYEIVHFAKKIDDNNKKIIDKMNLGKSSKVIIRSKSVAYPYICLIKINPNDISENIPIGYGLFLKGRLIENLAGKIIYNKNTENEMVLCPSFVPKQIKLYEDYKQYQIMKNNNISDNRKNNNLNITNNSIININNDSISNNSSNILQYSSDDYTDDIKSIEKYKIWLNKYYNKSAV